MEKNTVDHECLPLKLNVNNTTGSKPGNFTLCYVAHLVMTSPWCLCDIEGVSAPVSLPESIVAWALNWMMHEGQSKFMTTGHTQETLEKKSQTHGVSTVSVQVHIHFNVFKSQEGH